MHIHCLGLNHKTASIQLRERAAFNEEALKAALARMGCGHTGMDAVSEMVILSTCNRVEIYGVASDLDFDLFEKFLSDSRKVPLPELKPYLYHLSDEQAAEHLLEVAAGLDSLVLGEPQILGQVTHALEIARSQDTAGPLLSRLFQAAIHAGKRVRTETAISRNPASVSSMAVRLAVDAFPDIESAQVVVLGAGEMAELVVEALIKRGASRLLVINRTEARAHQLADRWGGEATTFEYLPEALQQADILVASTSAPHPLIYEEHVQAVMEIRGERPLVMIDISVPRNIDPGVGQVPGIGLYDLDTLKEYLSQSMAARESQMPGALSILAEEQAAYLEYISTLDLLPLIKDLHEQAESIRQTELEKTLRRLPDLSDVERKRIEALTEALVNKLLHAPITRLRAEAQCPRVADYAFVARSLFGLGTHQQAQDDGSKCGFSSNPCPLHPDIGDLSQPPASCDL